MMGGEVRMCQPLAGASGSMGDMGATGQTGVTGGWTLLPMNCGSTGDTGATGQTGGQVLSYPDMITYHSYP